MTASDEEKQQPTGGEEFPPFDDQDEDVEPLHSQPEERHDDPHAQGTAATTGSRHAAKTKSHDKGDSHSWYSQDAARRKLVKSVVKESGIFLVLLVGLFVAAFFINLHEQQNTQKALGRLIVSGREGHKESEEAKRKFATEKEESKQKFAKEIKSEEEAHKAAALASASEAHARKASELQAHGEASRARAEAGLSEVQAKRAASLAPGEQAIQAAQAKNTEEQARRESASTRLTEAFSSIAGQIGQRLKEKPSSENTARLKELEKRLNEVITKLNGGK